MIKAAAKALAEISPTRQNKEPSLLPPLESIRSVSIAVARAVGDQARKDRLADVNETQFESALAKNIWEPVYESYELA
jgi:malate dehydrogenase (oxaloacetate-decarboxylating)